jgi:hypothetical protein
VHAGVLPLRTLRPFGVQAGVLPLRTLRPFGVQAGVLREGRCRDANAIRSVAGIRKEALGVISNYLHGLGCRFSTIYIQTLRRYYERKKDDQQ